MFQRPHVCAWFVILIHLNNNNRSHFPHFLGSGPNEIPRFKFGPWNQLKEGKTQYFSIESTPKFNSQTFTPIYPKFCRNWRLLATVDPQTNFLFRILIPLPPLPVLLCQNCCARGKMAKTIVFIERLDKVEIKEQTWWMTRWVARQHTSLVTRWHGGDGHRGARRAANLSDSFKSSRPIRLNWACLLERHNETGLAGGLSAEHPAVTRRTRSFYRASAARQFECEFK